MPIIDTEVPTISEIGFTSEHLLNAFSTLSQTSVEPLIKIYDLLLSRLLIVLITFKMALFSSVLFIFSSVFSFILNFCRNLFYKSNYSTYLFKVNT